VSTKLERLTAAHLRLRAFYDQGHVKSVCEPCIANGKEYHTPECDAALMRVWNRTYDVIRAIRREMQP